MASHMAKYSQVLLEHQGPGSDTTSLINAKRVSNTWPLEPQCLRESKFMWAVRFLPHVLLLTVPLGFVGLGIVVLNLDKEAESDSGNNIMQAMAVTSTLWPILFAAVLGPTLKALALHYAVRGARLGTLEILSTSHTLVSSLRACFTLRYISWYSLPLATIWLLSPSGGQGALRALKLTSNSTSYEYPLASYPRANLSIFYESIFEGSSTPASFVDRFRALNGAAFSAQDSGLLHANGSSALFDGAVQRVGGTLEAARLTRRDLWRNVRIPFLHSLSSSPNLESDWIDVPSDTVHAYASLIGIPVRGIPTAKRGNTTFIIQPFYQTLQCTPWMNTTRWNQTNNNSIVTRLSDGNLLFPTGWPNIQLGILLNRNRPWTASDVLGEGSNLTGLLSGHNFSDQPEQLTLVVYNDMNLTLCHAATQYVDAAISCSRAVDDGDLACAVYRMRRTPGLTGPRNLTALDMGWSNMLLKYIPYTLPSLHPYTSGILENWLRDPPTAFLGVSNGVVSRYDGLPLSVFSDRLAMVLNTHIQASLNATIMVGSDGNAFAAVNKDWANTTSTWTEFTLPVYKVNRIWFALYLISAITASICAIGNLILRWNNIPDILSGVSALTRDSPFFSTPTPASTLDGSDRARFLKDRLVMIQDVCPDEEVGRIALSDAKNLVRLQKERMYI
ncbi:hypothetical protein T440DRAFT_270335 [Plenodomus tracheiphilus IPT5]|uniref:Transmembrane protein n=1 Tax=Plenodomus tracheiphilus IPT5 TaxID=1408161 RepID=A0A6A7BG19_9PLEO|nr:hypothetical protein T440DRAFT_270335 [Plenodomus tracheiphilus IPT5]